MISEEELFEGFTIGDWEVFPSKGILRNGETEICPEPKVFALLIALAKRDGDFATNDQLIDEVWDGRVFDDRPIHRAVALLRKLFQDSKPYQYVGTVYQRGYRLVEPVQLHGTTQQPQQEDTESGDSPPVTVNRFTRWNTTASFLIVVAILVLTAVIGKPVFLPSDPLKTFNDLPGYRLELKINTSVFDEQGYQFFGIEPNGEMVWFEDYNGGYAMDPFDGTIAGSVIQAEFQRVPTMFLNRKDSDDVFQVVFVFPYEPSDVRNLISKGNLHEEATINTVELNMQIDSGFRIYKTESGATIHIGEIPTG